MATVRDLISVSRAKGLDVPLVFELDADEKAAIDRYVACWIPDAELAFYHSAYRLAERGIPQGITAMVAKEMAEQGLSMTCLEPFRCD